MKLKTGKEEDLENQFSILDTEIKVKGIKSLLNFN